MFDFRNYNIGDPERKRAMEYKGENNRISEFGCKL